MVGRRGDSGGRGGLPPRPRLEVHAPRTALRTRPQRSRRARDHDTTSGYRWAPAQRDWRGAAAERTLHRHRNMTIAHRITSWGGARLSRRVSRSLPFLGAAIAVVTVASSLRRKGVISGTLDTGHTSELQSHSHLVCRVTGVQTC